MDVANDNNENDLKRYSFSSSWHLISILITASGTGFLSHHLQLQICLAGRQH